MCNTIIRLHFEYACAARYPNLNKNTKKKLQVLRNKCICFWLEANNRERIGTEHFDKTKWLPKDKRFKQCFSTSFFKLSSKMCLQYMNEIYKTSTQNIFENTSLKIFQPLQMKALNQKWLWNLAPFIRTR